MKVNLGQFRNFLFCFVKFCILGDSASGKCKMLFIDFNLLYKPSCYINQLTHNNPFYLEISISQACSRHSGLTGRHKRLKLYVSCNVENLIMLFYDLFYVSALVNLSIVILLIPQDRVTILSIVILSLGISKMTILRPSISLMPQEKSAVGMGTCRTPVLEYQRNDRAPDDKMRQHFSLFTVLEREA